MKFDLVIANPPYNIGNQVISETIKHCDKAVVLMPLSKYKGGKLHQYVEGDVELVDGDAFNDAAITDNLNIAVLSKTPVTDLSWEEFEMQSFDQRFIEFYRLNSMLEQPYQYIKSPKFDFELEVNRDFMLTMRTVLDGTHKVDNSRKIAADIPFNANNIMDKDNIPVDITHNTYSCCFIRFNTAAEKSNFSRFWYQGSLMNNLIKGMKKASGHIRAAIPNIDWSIDRDYEHLTYEQLLEIMRNEINGTN